MSTRFTDAHVRAYPELIGWAERYLKAYVGEFQFLVDAQSALNQGEEISVQVMRGVLNCMLSDSRVIGLHVPYLPVTQVTLRSGQVMNPSGNDIEFTLDGPRGGASSKVRDLYKESWPKVVVPKVTWHRDFGVSNHVQALLIHGLDKDKSILKVYRNEDGSDRYLWELHWFCKRVWPPGNRPYSDGIILMTEADYFKLITHQDASHLPLTRGVAKRDWRFCQSCKAQMDVRHG